MFDIRVRKRMARGLFKVDVRRLHEDTRKTDALFETEVVGSLIFGIKVVDRCGTGSTNWHQMRLGTRGRYGEISIQLEHDLLREQYAKRTSSLTLVQYSPLELEEHHLPNPTNHADLESASDTRSPITLYTLHSIPARFS